MFRIMGNRTPTRIRALGVHRVKEIGKGAAAFYVSVLEQELCAPCPQFSPSVAFELLLTVAHTAKLVQVRDLGRKNVGSRRRDSGQMGEPPKDAILLVDANYWQQYKTGSRPHWPNRQRAQGLWSSLQTFTPDLVPKVQELVHRFHADLESLTTSLFSLMDASLAEVEVAEVCDNLVSTQVLGLSPDGQLCQYVLWDASFHSLEVGHQWGMVPIRNLSKSKLKPRAAASGSIKKPQWVAGCGDTQAAAVLPFGHFAAWVAQQFRDTRAFLSHNGTWFGCWRARRCTGSPRLHRAEGLKPWGPPAVDPATRGLG